MEAVVRGSQAQGLWVLHISQPGRFEALMKVQEGQDQPGWEDGKTVDASQILPMPTAAHSQRLWLFAHLRGGWETGTGRLEGMRLLQ